ncbi:MAG: putative circadian clock protein KaiC [Pedosphaera sp.]|nr:putative circadian clock protein KaiC [Pedosphaera sp.]
MMHTKKRGGLIKTGTGIRGFDDITGGGLPKDRTTLIMGGPGSGKTVFAIQTLMAGVSRGEPGILVTFQESPRHIVENAATFGWDFKELQKDKLVILDARIRPNVFKSIELYLTGMLAGIKVVANEMGAKRIVFDSIDALLSMLGDRMSERHEIARLRDWLLESGLTAVITSQTEGDAAFASPRHGFMQFMADCVVNLCHQASNPAAPRSLRVVKYRGSGFVENEFPFVIGEDGLEMMQISKAEKVSDVSREMPANNIQQEIASGQDDFRARIKSLNRQLEIRKAELEFLLKSRTKGKRKAARQQPASAARAVGSLNPGKGKPSGTAKTLQAAGRAVARKRA